MNKNLITTVGEMVVITLPHGQMFDWLECIDFWRGLVSMMMDGCDAGGLVVPHIFVLFLLQRIFHGFRLTHETT